MGIVSIRSPTRGEFHAVATPVMSRPMNAFQSAPRLAGSSTMNRESAATERSWFQSAPRLAGSSTPEDAGRTAAEAPAVSIRSPTRGEFHLADLVDEESKLEFQSAPRLAGSSTGRPYGDLIKLLRGFQSAPRLAGSSTRWLRGADGGEPGRVSIRSPTRGEFHKANAAVGEPASAGFNPLPDSRGVPPALAKRDEAEAARAFQSAPRLAGSSTVGGCAVLVGLAQVSIRSPTRGEFHDLVR